MQPVTLSATQHHFFQSTSPSPKKAFRATRMQMAFMVFAIFSFAYERPLAHVIGMYRLEPRLFDITWLWALFLLFGHKTKPRPMPQFMIPWQRIILVFFLCAVIWQLWIPFSYGRFSLYYVFKYLEGLIVLVVFNRIALTLRQKNILTLTILSGGIFVALYAIPEYLRGGSTGLLDIGNGKVIKTTPGILFSSLGNTYFHVAMYSSFASIIAMALFMSVRSLPQKAVCFALAIFLAWPAFFCGARSGILATSVGWLLLLFQSRPEIKFSLAIIVLLGLALAEFHPEIYSLELWSKKSVSVRRLVNSQRPERQGNDAMTRVTLSGYDIKDYRWQGWRIPFIGAGFYVAPFTRSSGLRYRVGYGIHNGYLFALEQGGLLALILFLAFIKNTDGALSSMTKSATNGTDMGMASGARAFLHALLLVMLPGQVFWHGFGSENFNTYILLVFLLALKRTAENGSVTTDTSVCYRTDRIVSTKYHNY